ncbi:MAG: helix-hairpin-helix domain-containing protein, partial [Acidimicrobiales bacterium]
AIEASKSRGLQSLLSALAIRHVGSTTASALAGAFGHLDRLVAAAEGQLASVEGVGPKVAAAVAGFFASERSRSMVGRLAEAGVSFEGPTRPGVPQVLTGKSVVVTGTLSGWSREDAEAAVKARGGRTPGSVSARTSAVVVGAEPGTAKLARAQELGVPVVDEAGFAELLESGLPGSGLPGSGPPG